MKQPTILFLLVFAAAASLAVLFGPRPAALARMQGNSAGTDNQTSGSGEAWPEVAAFSARPSDRYALSSGLLFRDQWLYLYSDCWPADPYGGAYGYPWRFYDDTTFKSGSDPAKKYSRWPADLFAAMAKRQEKIREKVQDFQDDRRRSRQNLVEDIRRGLQNVFLRKKAAGFFDNRRQQGHAFRPARQGRSFGSGRRRGRQ